MKPLAIRAAEGGLRFMLLCIVAGFFASVFVSVLYSRTTGKAPPLTNATEVKAFEPGTGFNVAAYCKSAKTVTVANVPGAEVLGTRRIARNSDLDYVEWQDDNSNTGGVRYYVDKQGKPQHELVDVEGAVACMRAQR